MNTKKNSHDITMASFIIATLAVTLFVSWLSAEETVLTIASPGASLFSKETLLNGGVFPDITRTAFQRMGYTIVVEFVPWKRGLEFTKTGEYDGLMVVSYQEDREEHFLYSAPILDENTYLFSLGERTITYSSLKELSPYTIGTIRGSLLSSLLKAKNLTVEEVATHEQNIQKVMWGRVDLIAGQKLVIQNVLNTTFPQWDGALEIVGPPFHEGTLHTVISRKIPNYERILNDFNTGLQAIRADGTFEKILQAHGLDKGID